LLLLPAAAQGVRPEYDGIAQFNPAARGQLLNGPTSGVEGSWQPGSAPVQAAGATFTRTMVFPRIFSPVLPHSIPP
jgi:hypothetical protein